MLQFVLSAGVHTLTEPMRFDNLVVVSEVSIVGDEGAVIRLPLASARRRLGAGTSIIRAAVILSARLLLQLQGVTFQGGASSFGVAAVVVEHGELDMRNCTVRDVQGTRALHANGGDSAIRSSRFEANLGGAVAASSGSKLLLSSSVLVGNMAANGGALAVTGNLTEVTMVATRLERNSATLQGGGLHVTAGSVILANHTVLEENAAPEGATMHLSGGTTVFALPAPSGRWVNTAVPMKVPSVQLEVETLVSTLVLGAQDEDYPFACPPGTVGGTDIETQLSPVCVGACPAGSMCASATHTPQRAPPRSYRTSAIKLAPLCLSPVRPRVWYSLHHRRLLSEWLGRGYALPAGNGWCCD